MFGWLRKNIVCRHEFHHDDSELTGIEMEARPGEGATYKDWERWYSKVYFNDKAAHHTKRVKWPCRKCGKVFYGHCGVDILEHGKAI